MYKRITFNTHDRDGNWFAEAVDVMPRTGGGLAKIAGEMHPQVSRYLRELRSDKNHQFVLMTPMGSFEYWGMNVNGDVFPEVSLGYDYTTRSDHAKVALELERKWLRPHGKTLPPGDWSKFGFKTFEEALRYRHHINKDPSIAYGDVVLAVWNARMHRVEVIARHDREKAKQVGASEIIEDLDEGRPRQISMGCRVKFDVCTICGSISRTQRDYCECLRTSMGRVRDDGKIVGAVNFFPNFFDLSDVIVPAAKESGVLMKVAQSTPHFLYLSHDLKPTKYTLDEPNQLIKTASRKILIKKAKDKQADIEKKIIPNAGYSLARRVSEREPDLPRDLLRSEDFQGLLSTLALLGIVLKPREFQYSALCQRSRGMADNLHERGVVFRPGPANCHAALRARDFNPDIARLASDHLPGRSAFHPHSGRRVIRVIMIKEANQAPPVEEIILDSNEIMNKLGSAYTAYRDSLLTLPGELDLAVSEHFGYYQQNFFGDLLDRAMTKTADITDLVPERDFTTGYLCGAFRDTVCSDLWKSRMALPSHSPASSLLGS